MVIKSPAGNWEARIYSHGKQITVATFARKADAEKWEAAQKLQLVKGTWTNPMLGKVSLSAAIERFNEARLDVVAEHTWATDETNLRLHIPARMSRMQITAVNKNELTVMFTDMLRTHKRATVSRHRNTVSSLFAWAVEQGWLERNVVSDTKVPQGNGQETSRAVVRPFSARELPTVIAKIRAINPGYADLVEFASLTGLRWGELAALRVENFIEDAYPAIRVERSKSDGFKEKVTKGRKPRTIPLEGRAIEIMLALTEGRRHDALVFTAPRGGAIHARNFTRAVDWNTLTAHVFHDLRHTAITNWLLMGIDVKTASKWAGHSSPTTTLRIYSHYFDGDSDRRGLQILEEARRRSTNEGNDDETL